MVRQDDAEYCWGCGEWWDKTEYDSCPNTYCKEDDEDEKATGL